MIKPQIIEKDGKPQYAVIPIGEWRQIEAMLEELQDIRGFDPQTRGRSGGCSRSR